MDIGELDNSLKFLCDVTVLWKFEGLTENVLFYFYSVM